MGPFERSARHAAVQVVRVLREAGHVAYFAGGCVRDALLGHPPKDYDVATDAPPDKVRSLFKRSRYVGEAFGVVLVHMLGDRREVADPALERAASAGQSNKTHFTHQIEVATFRTEWGYEDGRRPSGVAFSTAEEDARRRDFTVNGLFEDPLAKTEDGRIIDYVGGRADLQRRVLRAIGDPDQRFREDYLRLLRAVRFAARLRFRLDRATADAMRRHAEKLSRISRERIGQEMEKMLTGPAPLRCVRLLHRLQLDGPALDDGSLGPPVLATVAAVARLARAEHAEYPTWLAAWMLDRQVVAASTPSGAAAVPLCDRLRSFVAAPMGQVVPRWRTALCLTNDQRDALRQQLIALADALDWPALGVAPRKRLLARPSWRGAWLLLRGLRHEAALRRLADTIDREAAPLLAQGVAPQPLITGDDLVAHGFKPGPRMGRLLDSLYDAQLELKIATREQALALARQVSL